MLQNAFQECCDTVQRDERSAKKHGREHGKPSSQEQATGHAAGQQTPPGPTLGTKPPASRSPRRVLPAEDPGSAVHQLCDLGKVTHPRASGFISKMREQKGYYGESLSSYLYSSIRTGPDTQWVQTVQMFI